MLFRKRKKKLPCLLSSEEQRPYVLTACCFLSLQLHMRIHAAYGSTKDISVYSSISLPPTHIYIVGRPTKKLQSQCQVGAGSSEPPGCCPKSQGPPVGGRAAGIWSP